MGRASATRQIGCAAAIGALASLGWSPAATLAQCGEEGGAVEAVYSLTGSASGIRADEELTLRIGVRANRPLDGYKLFVDWNEDWAELVAVEPLHTPGEGAAFELEDYEINDSNEVPNRVTDNNQPTLEEGFLRADLVFGAPDSGFDLPPGELLPVLSLRLRPRAGNRDNPIVVHLVEGPWEEGTVPHNSVRACGGLHGVSYERRGAFANVRPTDICLAPEDIDVQFSLGSASVARGKDAVVPFKIRGTEEIQHYTFSIDFDEETLEATEIEQIYRLEDGAPWAFQRFEMNNENDVPGSTGVDEGFLGGMVVFSLAHNDYALPASVENHVIDFHFKVREGAVGSSTEIRFLDNITPERILFINSVASCGHSVDIDLANSFVFIDGVIGIIDEITIFRRGDSNGDDAVDLSDSVHSLAYLFQGGPPPLCLDAADANDDGQVNISDPVAAFNALFLGAGALPPPFEEPGEDPTEDGLGCGNSREAP